MFARSDLSQLQRQRIRKKKRKEIELSHDVYYRQQLVGPAAAILEARPNKSNIFSIFTQQRANVSETQSGKRWVGRQEISRIFARLAKLQFSKANKPAIIVKVYTRTYEQTHTYIHIYGFPTIQEPQQATAVDKNEQVLNQTAAETDRIYFATVSKLRTGNFYYLQSGIVKN